MTKNWALIVGINEYNPLNFSPLKYAKLDAERIKAIFEEAKFDQVFLFSDDSPRQALPNGKKFPTTATYGNLLSFLQACFEKPFLNIEDNFWFFFAGHGERHRDRDYLIPMDASAFGTESIKSLLSVNYIRERLCRCGAGNVIMILDACRNHGSRSGAEIGQDIQKGVITISSCQPNQKSWEIDDLKQGAFTYAFLEALKQPRENNCATVKQLSDYLTQRVPKLCQKYGKFPVQVPRITVDPLEKQSFILMPEAAQQTDIQSLKLSAYRLQKTNPNLAKEICIRLNAQTAGRDVEVMDLFTEICGQLKTIAANNPSTIRQPNERSPSFSDVSSRFSSSVSTNNRKIEDERSSKADSNEKSAKSSSPLHTKKSHLAASLNVQISEFESLTIDESGQNMSLQKRQAQCFIEELDDSTVLEMMLIPQGNFLMGSSEAKAYPEELPVHRVTVNSFLIGKHPVTKEQWGVVARMPKVDKGLKKNPSGIGRKLHPVTNVSWEEANEFCARLSQKEGQAYRLPSEAEWEYACRAGGLTPYHFGNAITSDLVNYDGNYPCVPSLKGAFRNRTTQVGILKYANAFGLFDMHGNVWEWCGDHWHDSYNGAPTDGRAWEEGTDLQNKVMRGGSLVNEALRCRSASRQKGGLSHRSGNTGFRVVRTLKTSN